MMKKQAWVPQYTITPSIAQALMRIEQAKTIVKNIPLTPALEMALRQKSRLKSTHYSTYIEGNRLTLKETEEIIQNEKTTFQGRERDVKEVQNYWSALLKIEDFASRGMELSEELIKKIHAMVQNGKRAKPTPYRQEQNVIKDSATGRIVFLPPEAKDVSVLMKQLIVWIRKAEKSKIPAPIIAGLTHYQFVTIHPYYDGNGRTARLLATFILQRDGYGLNGFFSMEEYHALNLREYYKALVVHHHHNYYFGRATADLTGWVQYFTCLMANVFAKASQEVEKYAQKTTPVIPQEIQMLNMLEKRIVQFLTAQNYGRTPALSMAMGITQRAVRYTVNRLVNKGIVEVVNKSDKARLYKLREKYRKFDGK